MLNVIFVDYHVFRYLHDYMRHLVFNFIIPNIFLDIK